MNYSSAIFLVNSEVQAVNVSYERHPDGRGVEPFYTFKTFDRTLKAGDLVVIPTDTRHHMTVARVEQTAVDVDPASGIQLKWLVGKVDAGAYHDIIAREAEVIEQIKSAERRSQRDELAKKLLADNPTLQNLSMVTASEPALPAPEPAGS